MVCVWSTLSPLSHWMTAGHTVLTMSSKTSGVPFTMGMWVNSGWMVSRSSRQMEINWRCCLPCSGIKFKTVLWLILSYRSGELLSHGLSLFGAIGHPLVKWWFLDNTFNNIRPVYAWPLVWEWTQVGWRVQGTVSQNQANENDRIWLAVSEFYIQFWQFLWILSFTKQGPDLHDKQK